MNHDEAVNKSVDELIKKIDTDITNLPSSHVTAYLVNAAFAVNTKFDKVRRDQLLRRNQNT